MPQCTDIAPLLSAFNDGELPPLETDQITRHLDGCEGCRETLLDFVLLGHHMRSAVAMPSMEGLLDGVMGGIASSRRPLRQRLLYLLEQLRERWVAAVSLAGAAVAIASLVLVLAGPQTLTRISSWLHGHSSPVEVAQNPSPPAPAAAPSNSQTVVSRLEARHPSVAMWSEPDYKTTVIWLGDDASGNE
jgi:anti-sigma factor RsiW